MVREKGKIDDIDKKALQDIRKDVREELSCLKEINEKLGRYHSSGMNSDRIYFILQVISGLCAASVGALIGICAIIITM